MPRIAVIPGDGIGPEVTEAALLVLRRAAERYGIPIELRIVEAGDEALRKYGEALPGETWKAVEWADAILKGPVGESAGDVVVPLRRRLDLYANIRPAKSVPGAMAQIDAIIVRENTEDVYVMVEMELQGVAVALRPISERGSERIARVGVRYAKARRNKITIVHKANVLRVTDGLFRRVVRRVAEAEGVQVDERYIDTAVMDVVRRPQDFDVIVTTNLYGDILSDIAAHVAGGLGLAPGANVGDSKAMFEPVHGAAFDIAGKGIANPIAMIRSVAMMLEWLGYREAAARIEDAVQDAIRTGHVTPDMGGSKRTMEVAEYIASRL